MMNKFLLSSALTLGGTVAVASTAMAQSVDVNFSGTVQGICSFSSPSAGLLVTDGPQGPGPQFVLKSDAPGGSPGQVTVTCNQPAGLNVSPPIQTAGPSGAVDVNVSVQSPVGGIPPSNNGGSFGVPPGITPLTVNMFAGSPNGLQPGNYAYKVTLTVIP